MPRVEKDLMTIYSTRKVTDMSTDVGIVEYSAEQFEQLVGDVDTEAAAGKSLGMTWGVLKTQEIPNAERIIFGLGRGQVGLTVAATNVGKTTLALNIALTLASGGTWLPFVEPYPRGRRVMFLDGENTLAELKPDLHRMMRDWTEDEQAAVDDNLLILCDEEIDGEALDLSNPRHMALVTYKAQDFRPDLIIVDTFSALFNVGNENDNAEMKRRVMGPLKLLAKDANAVVWLQHHIGKQSEEARSIVHAYKGRGASNLGCLARTVIVLDIPDKAERQRIVLSVPKAKGYHLEDVAMRLDREARWFIVTNESVPVVPTSQQEIVLSVTGEMGTKEIVAAFAGKFSKRTVEDTLKKAAEGGKLRKIRRGRYAPPETATSTYHYVDGGKCGIFNADEDRRDCL
jgi:RecA-family ATPase